MGPNRIASSLRGATEGSVEAISVQYFHSDHLGSSNVITDKDGNQSAHYEYLPYGETSVSDVSAGSSGTSYKFTGKEQDASTGLYFYAWRYYDPYLGRFTQPDTIVPNPTNPQDFNRYSYCNNNPINYTDPTGHSKVSDWLRKKVAEPVNRAIDKAIRWLENLLNTPIDVDVEVGGGVPFGPGGENSGGNGRNTGGGAYDTGYDEGDLYEPVSSQIPESFSAPSYNVADIMMYSNLGQQSIIESIDPVKAALRSGDITRAMDIIGPFKIMQRFNSGATGALHKGLQKLSYEDLWSNAKYSKYLSGLRTTGSILQGGGLLVSGLGITSVFNRTDLSLRQSLVVTHWKTLRAAGTTTAAYFGAAYGAAKLGAIGLIIGGPIGSVVGGGIGAGAGAVGAGVVADNLFGAAERWLYNKFNID